MFQSLNRALQCATLLVIATFSTGAYAQATYYQNTDNENNAHTGVADNDMETTFGNTSPVHPIEFNIVAAAQPDSSAMLTLRAYDVDEEQGETDDVYINGHFLGRLTGANNVWSVTSFNVNPAWLVAGNNLVEVRVDTSGDPTVWVVAIDWGQVLVDGGGAVDGDTRGVQITGWSVNAGTVTINTSTNVHSTTGGNYRLQISLIDPNGNAVTVLTQDFAAAAGADVVRNVNPTYPLASVSGLYTIQAQLFWLDPNAGNFPVQQDIAIAQFTHTAGAGPSNIQNDSDGDGLLDSIEATLGTNPNDADSDGDGVNDGAEVGPNVATPIDGDGDGVIDALESSVTDTDNDGVSDQADPSNTNPCVPAANNAACLAYDSDGDGLTNAQEDAFGTGRNDADTDGDGFNDGAEVGGNVNAPLDTDGDVTINALESASTDADGDGVVDQNDAANNNACVPNVNSAVCLATDTDGDGLTNGQEDALGTDRSNPDSDGDGANDGAEPGDTDGDGVPNALESSAVDSDGDGLPNQSDPANNNACVPNANSAVCLATDSDGDGLTNAQEDAAGTGRNNPDTDGDGALDGAEAGDTDGDGIPNVLESSVTDTDGDGVSDQADSANGNACSPDSGSAACLATDGDNDGLTNAQEDAIGTDRSNPDTDGDGANDGSESGDTDGDGLPNALESSVTDSDGDGVPNQTDSANGNPCVPDNGDAACLATDSDGDGLTNAQEDTLGTVRNDADSDADGVSDGAEIGNPASPTDTDGDGIPDAFEPGTAATDTDSDDDGIADGVEIGPNPANPRDTDGDGIPNYQDRDSDADGIPDALEMGPTPAQPVDTDGDSTPDYLDADSDDDSLPDTLEGGASGVDTDGDGIDDAFDIDEVGGGDVNHDGVADTGNVRDTDGDGAADFRDIDTDNDGILDAFEGTPTVLTDTDGDGTPDVRDLDSDDDGIADVREAGLIDANSDGLMDAGQTRTANPPDVDADGARDFRDVDSTGDGTFDIAGTSAATSDANHDGRVDAGPDSDEDGIRDVGDGAPLVFGTFTDGDADGIADAQDLDLDNDGVPNAADGSDDTDGDGLPNLFDLDSDGDGVTDLVEAGGVDANGDGLTDSFVDVNHDGLSDQFESALGGHTLPLPDTDGDGVDDHRDLDSDGDGAGDLVENGGTDANGDGRADGTDGNHNGLVDVLEGGGAGGHALPRPDSDGDATVDSLDLDSDNDGVTDSREGRGDADHDGIPDSLDSPGQIQTAVRGTGAIDPFTVAGLLAILGLVVMRRRGASPARLLPVLVAGCLSMIAPRAHAAEPVSDGMYVGVDFGISRLEPRNRDGGYLVDDDQSLGMRLNVGYSWSPHWSAEAFYADGGKAGISSDNPAVGHLGEIEYRMWGVGAVWMQLGAGRSAKFFPLIKLGAVQISNSANSDQILYKKLNDVGVYVGGGGGMRLGKGWLAQAEVVSYDQDELFFTLGVLKHF